ncbi:MAG: nucleotidyl transferase AbiEii/AbiGii toxin family protein [Deltaproteobacteria bacterium]|nr:nucleotidyl transferase AbiEii/AbiGii toxin family protein [Deltaproteobacteria bacterium]
MLSDRDAVELFHLHFVRLLSAGRDKARYVVKGGCNLRFFFGSIRSSQDLDLDVGDVPQHVVKERVDGILAAATLRETLASVGLVAGSVTAPKQTPTTQRWKIELRITGRAVSQRTKIEISRRGTGGGHKLEAVDARLLQRHQLMPVLACHYLLPAAIRQKVGALVGRKEVQARDVFDLALLSAKTGDSRESYADLASQVPAAVDRVWALSYPDYKGQVLAYLEPTQAEPLSSEEAWDAMQLQVVTWLDGIAEAS